MDKVLVFTNYASGHRGLPSVKGIDEWYYSYPDKDNTIVFCQYDDKVNIPVLQSVKSFQNEGIYLVFDEIDNSLLEKLLNECRQNDDRICVLIHTRGNYTDLGYFIKWKNIYALSGMHTKGEEYLYEPIFDIIVDPKETNKLNRIINTYFLPRVKNLFMQKCLCPNINLRDTFSYYFLSKWAYDDVLDTFIEKYELSHNFEEYKEDFIRLKKYWGLTK